MVEKISIVILPNHWLYFSRLYIILYSEDYLRFEIYRQKLYRFNIKIENISMEYKLQLQLLSLFCFESSLPELTCHCFGRK